MILKLGAKSNNSFRINELYKFSATYVHRVAQQEELRQTNEQLGVRSNELEQQKQAIREQNQALEKNQAEMKVAQATLEKKAKELELASKYKSEFLANMSHELRTPLNSLLILAQLLAENKDSNLTDKQIEYARTIHSAGSDLLTLINEILDLSKVEAGKIEVNIEEVSLTDLVATVEQKFCHIAEKKGLAFHITKADNLPAVLHTDVQRLNQIINNLLSNAFKFTSLGEVVKFGF
jgi:signal transduction histidine kinase